MAVVESAHAQPLPSPRIAVRPSITQRLTLWTLRHGPEPETTVAQQEWLDPDKLLGPRPRDGSLDVGKRPRRAEVADAAKPFG